MRRGWRGRGSSDPGARRSNQRGEADVKAAMRAQGSPDRQTYSGAANQATEAWVVRRFLPPEHVTARV